MQHKIIDDALSPIELFREQNKVHLGLISKMPAEEQLIVLTEILHHRDHKKHKRIINYMAQLNMDIHHYDTAIMYYLKLFRLTPSIQIRTKTLQQIGNAFLAKGDPSLAIDHFKKILHFTPNDAQVYELLGKIYYSTKQYDEAIEHIQKSMTLSHEKAALHGIIGLAALRQMDLVKAIKHFKRSIELDPEDHISMYGYGQALCQYGCYDTAKKVFKDMLAKNVLLKKALFGLALVHLGKNDIAKAKHYLKELPWVEKNISYVEDVPLTHTTSGHAYTQAAIRKVDLDKVTTLKNFGTEKEGIIKLFPYTDDGLWSGYEVIYNAANRTMITVINHTIRHKDVSRPESTLARFLKSTSYRVPNDINGTKVPA